MAGVPSGWVDVVRALRRHPSGVLLAVQLLGLFLYPLMEDAGAGRALVGAFGIAVSSALMSTALIVVTSAGPPPRRPGLAARRATTSA